MNLPQESASHSSIVQKVLWWSLLTIPSSFVIGNVAALMLWSVDQVTLVRFSRPQIIWFLPAAGVLIYLIIRLFRETSSNIVLQHIHAPNNGVTEKSAVPVLLTTIITHLFGGSAGREGAAIQIGASLSQLVAKLFKLSGTNLKIVCTSGIAAAFGAVFGAPLAGAFFALEVAGEGRFPYNALLPCIVASIVGVLTCNYWGVHLSRFDYLFSSHSHPMFNGTIAVDLLLLVKSGALGAVMGLLCCLFFLVLQYIKKWAENLVSPKWAIPLLGGILLVALCLLLDTQQYLGLGVAGLGKNAVSIASALNAEATGSWDWLAKFLFVIITLGFGFRGGEVTPLLFIGATLGSTLAILLNAPVPLFACLGFVAVLGGSANAPFACSILGIELFGAEYTTYYAFACFVAYFLSPTSKRIQHLQTPFLPKILDAQYLKERDFEEEPGDDGPGKRRDTDPPKYFEGDDFTNKRPDIDLL